MVNKVDHFTVGEDRDFDQRLIPYDIIGSVAHASGLNRSGLLSDQEFSDLSSCLNDLLKKYYLGDFVLPEHCEDVHSAIEFYLCESLGETGKKIHTARSRNDQSLLNIKLYLRDQSIVLSEALSSLFEILQAQSMRHKDCQMPGYTHSQLAMPSSIGLWLGAYAELVGDDLEYLVLTTGITDRNPLGSAAGFGSSFPIDREFTTHELGFKEMHVNSVAAQMYRVRTEKLFANAMAMIASTLSRLCSDVILYVNANYQFIRFSETFCTGSSIMPHKRNPDVFELIRAKCALIQDVPNRLTLLGNNLQSGYHRDFQLSKEVLFPALDDLIQCIEMAALAMATLQVNETVSDFSGFPTLLTVESIETLMLGGLSFREAYHQVSDQVKQGTYTPGDRAKYTHIGSIGNPGNERVQQRFDQILESFRKRVKPVKTNY